MSCHCSYGYEESDGEFANVWREYRVQSARVPHRCCECGDVIAVGDRYCAAFGAGNGAGHTWKRCASCAALAELVAELNQSCPLWGGLAESCQYTDGVSWYEWRQKAKSLDAPLPPTPPGVGEDG